VAFGVDLVRLVHGLGWRWRRRAGRRNRLRLGRRRRTGLARRGRRGAPPTGIRWRRRRPRGLPRAALEDRVDAPLDAEDLLQRVAEDGVLAPGRKTAPLALV